MRKFLISSLGSALTAAVYIALVAWLMLNANNIFGGMKTIWGPIAFLLLFVLSASITGSLVLGRPTLLYLDGKKKEAVRHFGLTLLYLFIILVVVFVVLIATK
jgi:hypothetical protein